MIYEEETRVLRRCLFDVHNEVGLGRQEPAYHRACAIWLEANGIPFTSKAPHHLRLAGEIAHTLYPDLVAWEAVTIELKAVARDLRDEERVQIFDYLKCRGDRLGLLANMGLDRVHVERIVYEASEPALEEDWSYWSGGIGGRDRQVGMEVRQALHAIHDTHGTGYGAEVIAKLVHFELRRRALSFEPSPVSKAYFKGQQVDESPLDCLVVDGRVLLTFTALFDDNAFCVNRGKSFLRALGLTWGIAANFGKKAAQFCGLRVSR